MKRTDINFNLCEFTIAPMRDYFDASLLTVQVGECSPRSLFGFYWEKDMLLVVDFFFLHLIYN